MIRLIDTMMFQPLWTSHSPVARYETCVRSNRTNRLDRIETRLIFGEHVVISNFLSDLKKNDLYACHKRSYSFFFPETVELIAMMSTWKIRR